MSDQRVVASHGERIGGQLLVVKGLCKQFGGLQAVADLVRWCSRTRT